LPKALRRKAPYGSIFLTKRSVGKGLISFAICVAEINALSTRSRSRWSTRNYDCVEKAYSKKRLYEVQSLLFW